MARESNWKKWTGRGLVLVGLVWLGFVFVKYNPCPYVGFWEALFDCTPLGLIVVGVVVWWRAIRPEMLNV